MTQSLKIFGEAVYPPLNCVLSRRLPNIPRPAQQICVIGDAAHNDEAAAKNIPHMSADDLKKLNKDKVTPDADLFAKTV